MKSILSICCLTFLFAGSLFSQECAEVRVKLPGYFYAGSSVEDTAAFGGFYQDGNVPKPIPLSLEKMAEAGEFQLLALPDSVSSLSDSLRFFKVFLVNQTDSIVGLSAQDSRLSLVRQVFYNGSWQDIEYLPSSWCGNSYHQVFVKPVEYWDFDAPCLKGRIQTKLRFALQLGDGQSLFSNEFDGSFYPRQLRKEQGHQAINLMDPYDQ